MLEAVMFFAIWAFVATAVACDKSRLRDNYANLYHDHESLKAQLRAAQDAARRAEALNPQLLAEVAAVHEAVDTAHKSFAAFQGFGEGAPLRDWPPSQRTRSLFDSMLKLLGSVLAVAEEAKVPTFCTLTRTLTDGEVRSLRYPYDLSERVQLLVDPNYVPRLLWH